MQMAQLAVAHGDHGGDGVFGEVAVLVCPGVLESTGGFGCGIEMEDGDVEVPISTLRTQFSIASGNSIRCSFNAATKHSRSSMPL